MRFALQIFAVAASGLACTPVSAADYVKSESGDASVYSRAVIATGGRIRRLTGADAGHYPQSLRQSAAEFFKTDFPASTQITVAGFAGVRTSWSKFRPRQNRIGGASARPRRKRYQ